MTAIGSENEISLLLRRLIELDYDTIKICETSIKHIENPHHKRTLRLFCMTHGQHIRNLKNVMYALDFTPPNGPTARHLLQEGRIIIADMSGDAAVLNIIHANKKSLAEAYERASSNSCASDGVRSILRMHCMEEQKQSLWLEKALEELRVA